MSPDLTFPKWQWSCQKRKFYKSCSQEPDKPISVVGHAVAASDMPECWKLLVRSRLGSSGISVTCLRLLLWIWFKMFWGHVEWYYPMQLQTMLNKSKQCPACQNSSSLIKGSICKSGRDQHMFCSELGSDECLQDCTRFVIVSALWFGLIGPCICWDTAKSDNLR